ncbi:MAG TPA: NAD(P)-dependent oxidoreductase [Burkholderiaceae bacterium]|nr:NAD(P)-dependent oxidoreductase [Burkholderiaceae bacterium]
MSTDTIGVCGLGIMGAAMAHRLIDVGHPIMVWNRSPEKITPLSQRGAQLAASPKELADQCTIVITCLTDQKAVEQVVFQENGLAASKQQGGVLVDHSSIAPQEARSMAKRLFANTQRHWLDAPVSGGVTGVQNSTLAIMVGGDQQALEQTRPYLKAYSARITHMGDVGSGQVAKLCNQIIVASTIGAISEAVALAAQSGLNAKALTEALEGGWADSVLLKTFVPRMADSYSEKLGAADIMHKDVKNTLEFAESNNIQLNLTKAVEQLYAQAAKLGLGQHDISEIVRLAWPNKPPSN